MRRIYFLLFTVLLSLTIITPVWAQNNAGITLRPATIAETVDPGAVKQYSFVVRNESGSEQQYYLSVRDIVGVRDGNVPVFADEALEKTAYELSQWVTLENNTLAVPAGGEAVVNFSMNVPADAAPGGHFAGVFVSMEPPRMRESGAAIGYEVANIISIRVSGDVNEHAEIRQFSTDNYVYGAPDVTFSVRVENKGNTLVRPVGPLEITNMFGKRVDGGLLFNESAGGVFPNASRDFTVEWSGERPGFGRYEAVLSAAYGEESARKTMSSTAVFWILPMEVILPALGVLATILLITYVSARLYVNRKLAHYATAGSSRRLVRNRRSGTSPLLFVSVIMLTVTAFFLIGLLFLFA
jgi:hypothetical protein